MELEVYKKSDFYEDYIDSQKEYYERTNADAYFAERLAEKEREIALLKEHICNGDVSRLTWIDDCIAKDKVIAELKKKLEDVQASMYCDVVDANMENRRLKRALWLERARRAAARKNYWYARSCHEGYDFSVSIDGSHVKYIGCIKRTNYDWLLTWSEVEHKCRAKAEEYK